MSSNSLNVDQRIVQMQFDNAQFEQGAATTMGTLEKLKNSLNFNGQANSLNEVSKAIGGFSTGTMISAMDAANSKFKWFEVSAITMISNITTKIQHMGERLVSAVTVDPVKAGWKEYEQKMDSIKTILNSAKDKNGASVTLDQVKKKIEELNVYADKTIYSFSDMTNNIGKFTNAGVDLDTATAAIQGVANAAAAAGADTHAASRAMYNFAQSLSLGYVQRLDWRSIENANMATVEFKEELLKTAVEMGTVERTSDGMYMALTQGAKGMQKEVATSAAMFVENLQYKWLTNDVLIKTLERYSDETTAIGKKASKAATEIHTLSKLFDTLGEAMQSGWSATWEKIVGDYDQAGVVFTKINDVISGALTKRDNDRIDFLDELMNQSPYRIKEEDWLPFADNTAKEDMHNYISIVKKVAREHNVDIDGMIKQHHHFKDTLKEGWFTQDILDDVNAYIKGLKGVEKAGKGVFTKEQVAALKNITGNLKDADSAYFKLQKGFEKTKVTKADWLPFADTQNKDDLHNYITIVKQVAREHNVDIDGMIDKHHHFKDTLKEGWLTQDIINETDEYIKNLEASKKAGKGAFTKDQVKGLKAITASIKDSNSAYAKLHKEVQKTGRDLLLSSFGNFFKQLERVFKRIGKAYDRIFPKTTADRIYKVFESVYKFSKEFKIADSTIDHIGKTFRGLFSIFDIFRMALVAVGKGAFNIVKSLFGFTDSILGVSDGIGQVIYKFRNFLKESNLIEKVVMGFSNGIVFIIKSIQNLRILDVVKVALVVIANVLSTVVKLALQIVNAVISSRAIIFIFKLLQGILLGIFSIVGSILPRIIDLIKWLLNLSQVKKAGSSVLGFFKSIAGFAFGGVIKFINKLIDLVEKLNYSGTATRVFDTIAGFITTVVLKVAKAITTIHLFINELLKLESVQNIIQKVKTFFSDIFELIGEKSKTTGNSIKDFFKGFGSNLPTMENVLQTIDGLLNGSIDKIEFFKESFGKAVEGIKKFFEDKFSDFSISNIFSFFSDKKDGLSEGANTVKEKLSKLATSLKEGFENLSVSRIIGTTTIIGFVYLLWQIGFLVKEFGGLIGRIRKLVKINAVSPLGKFLKSLTHLVNSQSRAIDAKAFFMLSLGIGVLAGAIYSLCQLPIKDVTQVCADLMGVLLVLGFVIRAIGYALSGRGATTNITFKEAEKIDPNKNPVFGALATFITGCKEVVSKSAQMAMVSVQMMALAQSVYTIAKAIAIISAVFVATGKDWVTFGVMAGTIASILVGVTVAIAILGKQKQQMSKGAALGILAIGATIALIVHAMNSIKIDDHFGDRVGTMITIVVALGVLMTYLSKLDAKAMGSMSKMTGSMILLAIAINLLVVPLMALSLVPAGRLIGTAVAIGIVAAALGVLGAFSSDLSPKNAFSIMLVATALTLLSTSLMLLTAAFGVKMVLAAVTLAGLIAVITWAGIAADTVTPGLNALSKAIIDLVLGAVSIYIVAAGINLIVKALGALGPALVSFISGFVEFSKILLLNAPIVAAGVAAIIGIACMAIMAQKGTLISTIVSLVSSLGVAFLGLLPKSKILMGIAIISLLGGVIGLLEKIMPDLIDKVLHLIVEGIFSLAKAIVRHGGGILDAIGALGMALLTLVTELIKRVLEGISGFLDGLGLGDTRVGKALKSWIDGMSTSLDEGKGNILKQIDEDQNAYETSLEKYDNMFDNVDQSDSILESMTHNTEAIEENTSNVTDAFNLGAEEIQESKDNYIDTLQIVDPDEPSGSSKGGRQRNVVEESTTLSTKNSPEKKEEAKNDGAELVKEYQEGAKEQAESGDFNIDYIDSFFDKDGNLKEAKMAGFDMSKAFGDGASGITDIMDLKSSEGFAKLATNLDGDKAAKLMEFFTTSMKNKTDLSFVSEEAKEEVDKAEKEIKNAGKESGKEEKKTKKQTVKVETKVDDKESKSSFKKSGDTAANEWIAAFNDKKGSIKTNIINSLKSASKGANSETIHKAFRDSGIFSANGLLNGLEGKMNDLYNKGVRMATMVNSGYKATVKQQSPSKVFYQNGLYTVQGLLNALNNKSRDVYKAGSGVGNSAINGTKSALAQMSTLLASDIDSTPTIRPVLDLSDVAKGARSINGMFGGSTLSVNSLAASSLSASMNSRQNGTDPVLEAINNLSRNLTATPSNTYNINGITYDDGSNIANAIGMLTRAAIVEGRA